MTDPVSLVFYDEKYNSDLDGIHLSADHRRFTQTPAEVMGTLADKSRRLVLILSDDKCVGYFILDEGEELADLGFSNALLIRSLAINPFEQSKGLAFRGMAMLPKFVKNYYSDIIKLVLIVNEKNIPAQKLYQKVGFAHHASRNNEKHGVQFIWYYDL